MQRLQKACHSLFAMLTSVTFLHHSGTGRGAEGQICHWDSSAQRSDFAFYIFYERNPFLKKIKIVLFSEGSKRTANVNSGSLKELPSCAFKIKYFGLTG